jgi:hypothetical protein
VLKSTDWPEHSVMLQPTYGVVAPNALLQVVKLLAGGGGVGFRLGGGGGGWGTVDGGGDGGGEIVAPEHDAPVTVYCMVDVHGEPG